MREYFLAITTETGVPLASEKGEILGELVRQFADSLKDPAFKRPLTHLYEEFRKRQEIKLSPAIAYSTVGGMAAGAALLHEIDVALSFVRTGQVLASSGTDFLMKSLTALHSHGVVNAEGLKDISEEELLALLSDSI